MQKRLPAETTECLTDEGMSVKLDFTKEPLSSVT